MDPDQVLPTISSSFPPSMDLRDFQTNPIHRKWQGPFSFVLGADPQFGMIGTCKLKLTEPTWKPEMILCKEAIQRINSLVPRPKFFVVCGDMLDAFPFEKENLPYYNNNDISIRDLQYADFMDLFTKELHPDIKLIFAPGNHDVGDAPTTGSLTKYRKEFGPDYFSFWVGGVKFVVLNSQFFFSPEALPNETEQHLQWIEDHVEDSNAKYIVVFQHIPFFGKQHDEETLFCNIPKQRRAVLMEQLWRAGVRYVFCGHYHKNAGGNYKTMEQLVTGAMGAAFGEDPSGFRVFHVGDCEISNEYVKLRQTTDCHEFLETPTASSALVDLASSTPEPSSEIEKEAAGAPGDISNFNCPVPEIHDEEGQSDHIILTVVDKIDVDKESTTSLGKTVTYSGRSITPSEKSLEVTKSNKSDNVPKRRRPWVWCCGARMMEEER